MKIKPLESAWRVARCLGEENLAQALSDFEAKGIEVRFALFSGMGEMETGLAIRQKAIAPIFILIGRQRDA